MKIGEGTVKSFRVLLLILFLGYYGGITLFPHTHLVNGITIVHSHPYKSDKGSNQSSFPHSGKELIVIQLLSDFIITALALSFVASVLGSLLYEIPHFSLRDGYAEPGGYRTNSLRAPPGEMLILNY